MKLNLGCGNDVKDDFINADHDKKKGIDVVMDINKFPWPFKDNSFDYVLCSRILEYSLDISKVMGELYRITKKEGIIEVISPYHKSDGAFKHSSFITETTPLAYLPENSFTIMKKKYVCHGKIRKLIPFKKFFSYFLWNVYDTIYLKIKIIK